MKQLKHLLLGLCFVPFFIVSKPISDINPTEYRIPENQDVFPVLGALPVKLSGYVKAEAYWDTRQVVGARDDQVLLYPERKLLDCNGQDINARGEYTMSPIQTRLRLDINGPNIKHAKSRGVMEFDFFGRADIANIMRMRHAYLVLEWEKVTMLAGQAYQPLYILGIDPRTISFNTGIPMEAFARSPQCRISYKPNQHLELLGCVSTELDNPSDGPIGFSTTYIRNAVVPRLDFQIRTYFNDNIIGFGVDYKRIRPRLKTDTCLKANETLNSAIAIAYASLTWESINTRLKLLFVQNPTDMNMTGGYAVSSIDETCDKRTYTNLNGIALWNDTEITKSDSVIPGWFVGFIKNLGSRDCVLPNVVDSEGVITDQRIYGFGTDIDYTFRFAPRISWKVHNFLLGIELEWTRSAYGTIDCKGNVIDTCPVNNVRLLVALFYYL
jgi:hypothetical protein